MFANIGMRGAGTGRGHLVITSLRRLRKTLIPLSCTVLASFLPALAQAQSPPDIGELFASETTARGPALLAGTGMSVASGSQLAAGKSVATLRLARGGEVRLCPATGLTVSAVSANVPQQSQELMLSMDTGSVEFDYPLNDLEDTLVTPDFKFMLAGPGVFHFALGVNNHGDTCVKPLRGNSASVIVSEMMGNAVYQVKPDEAVIFPAGKLSSHAPLEGECGCPAPLPVIQAENQEPKESTPLPSQTAQQENRAEPAGAESAKSIAAVQPTPTSDVTAPLPAEKPDAVHVQVDVPLVFRANAPEPVYAVARIKFSALPNINLPQENQKPIVLKPGKGEVSAKIKERKGFFGKIKGFFAAIFH